MEFLARHRLIVAFAILSFAVLLFLWCSKKQEKPEKKRERTSSPATSPMADVIRFQYAVYLLPGSTSNALAVFHKVLAKDYSSLKVTDKIPTDPSEPIVHVHLEKNFQQEYAPPSVKSLKYFGSGITDVQALALQHSTSVFILEFAHPKTEVWPALHTANILVEQIARKTQGLIWDKQTREIFSPDAWHEKRLGPWENGLPNVSNQTVIHAYNNGEYHRAITLGMAKMGLPDIVIEEFPWSDNGQVSELIDLFCQSLAEKQKLNFPGQFKIDLREIRDDYVRDKYLKSLKPNGLGKACLSLKQGKWEEGDPQNRLIELDADLYDGNDPHARQDNMLSSAFGWEDSIQTVEHDNAELLAESERERAKLPELQKLFNQGLEPGEFIQVKAPFRDGNYTEWMWVEITSWKSDRIKGLLENQPFHIPNLHPGQVVEVRQEDIFDYLHYYPDKRKEGNTTGPILERLNKKPNEKESQPPIPLPNCDDN